MTSSKLILVVLILAFVLPHFVSSEMQNKQAGKNMMAEDVIKSWPMKPQEAAKKLMAKYGPPNEVTPTHLIWHKNGPWKATFLYSEEIPHSFPVPHTDFLEQFIDYHASPDKFDDLAEYDGSVIVERTKGEMSARCDKEENNILALNLANDIVTGKRTVEEARKEYANQVMKSMMKQPAPLTEK